MPRPALIIGLGGTGQWVLTYLKKELLDNTKGKGVPKEVRLVAFDTTRQVDERRSRSSEEEPVVVEGVQLDIDEFYHLGGNIEQIVREIAQENKHSHISSWLQGKTYLSRLGAGQYMLEEGAGQMRPFGRMAVFKDLEMNPENSKIFGTLRDAIHDIRREVKENRSLEISIVASLAGGTGAGIAIDVAHIVRTIAEDIFGSRNFVIRGFFVLPRAFHRFPGGDNRKMRARAFAAIRELSRFITVFGDREYPMIYNPKPRFRDDLQRPVKKRLFDLCYLVDAHRSRNSLDDVEPKFGVFPSIADALLAFVDDRSGQEHTEHLNKIMPKLARGDDTAYFSAIGTYSIAIPVNEIAEENACRLALDFLNRLIKPEFGDEGRVIRLSFTQNQEIAGEQPDELVQIFMEESYNIDGMEESYFLCEVAGFLEQGGINNKQFVEQVADYSNLKWLAFIEPRGVNEESSDLLYEVKTVLEHSLSQDVKTSRELKEKPEFGFDRIEKEVERYLAKYLRKLQSTESPSDGKFREALARYSSLQVEQFQRALGNYCMNLLNGSTYTDPELSKSGKLGFVQEFLNGLSRKIEEFCKFMERVGEIRRREGRLALKHEEVQQARSRMFEDRKKSGFFKSPAHESQKQFIQLMEEQVEFEKDEIVLNHVNQVALQFRNYCTLLKENIDDWVIVLASGGADQTGLYEELNNFRQFTKAKRERDENFSCVRQEETDGKYEENLYRRFADQALEDMFNSVKWVLNEDGTTVNLEMLGDSLMDRKRPERDRLFDHNVKVILRATRDIFRRSMKEESIGKQLIDRYSEDDLARKLFETGSPLINFSSAPRFGQYGNFLAVKFGISEGDERYFQEVVYEIGKHSGAGKHSVKLLQNENAYKCTLISTIDVINADCLTAYEELASAYTQFDDDRRLLHNFPAEVNAVYYEQKVRDKLQNPYRMFLPRLVSMMEYKDWVRQFTRCLAYNLVKLGKGEEGNQIWVLHLPRCNYKGKKYNAQVIELTGYATGKADILEAMDTFVFKRKDCRREYDIPIHYDHLLGALILAEKEIGGTVPNIRKLRDTIKTGFINDFSNSNEQFNRDLGDLMHIMLLEETDRLAFEMDVEIPQSPVQKTQTCHMVLRGVPEKIAVGQKFKLRVEIQPGVGEAEKNSFELSEEMSELYCFVNAEGLQLAGNEAAAMPWTPNSDRPTPVEFELQGHVRGKQTFTAALFFEDHEAKRLRIFKTSRSVTVTAPKAAQKAQPILPQIDIRVAPQPDFLLHVQTAVKGKTGGPDCRITLNYRLTSYLPGVRFREENVGETVLDTAELIHFHTLLNQALEQTTHTQPGDVRQRMLSFGTYLFRRLFPPDTAGKFLTAFWQAKEQINSWLIVEDVVDNGINWIPWELAVPYRKGDNSPPGFLGERYRFSRWTNGLGATLYGEFPFGDIAFIDYQNLTWPESQRQYRWMTWRKLLIAQKGEHLRKVLGPGTSVYAVHIIRHPDQVSGREIVDRAKSAENGETCPEEEALHNARLDLKLKRPIVTFSILNRETAVSPPALHRMSLADRVLPFLRAGAGAVVCPRWPTTERADRVFWKTFYHLLEHRIPLGEAALRARLSVRDAFPHLADWLSYTVFGDPRARAYWPEESQGYTALECLAPGEFLLPGETYTFQARLSAYPPVGFKGRLVKFSTLPDDVRALFLAPDLQETIPEPIPLEPANPDGTLRVAVREFKTPRLPGTYPLIVQFFADDEPVKSLKLMLKVDYE